MAQTAEGLCLLCGVWVVAEYSGNRIPKVGSCSSVAVLKVQQIGLC
jgi:hypothetical protein